MVGGYVSIVFFNSKVHMAGFRTRNCVCIQRMDLGIDGKSFKGNMFIKKRRKRLEQYRTASVNGNQAKLTHNERLPA